jgi:hypothetical protein
MGQEARCTVRFQDTVSEGNALLETDDLVFRGDEGLRLKLPFEEMRSVKALDGELHLQLADGPAVFELGGQAEKWAHRILNPKGLLDKLGVKPGMKVAVLGVDDPAFLADLRARTEDISFEQPASATDAIFVAVNDPSGLDCLAALKRAIRPDGAVWVVFRKGRKDFNQNDILRGGLAAGLVDVKVVRFSDTHTASKFVIRKAERGRLQ